MNPTDGRLTFTAKNIPELANGNIGRVINHGIEQLIKDVIDRHGDKGKRVLNIKLAFTPDLDDSGALDTIDVQAEVKATVPTRKNTKPFKILPMSDGTAIFTPTSPHDPRQLPLPTMGGADDGAADGDITGTPEDVFAGDDDEYEEVNGEESSEI